MKNHNGFTGLEAAIVLIAFVVVAAVFSYVVLGPSLSTTQESQRGSGAQRGVCGINDGVCPADCSIHVDMDCCISAGGDAIVIGRAGLPVLNGCYKAVNISPSGNLADLKRVGPT